MKAQNLANFEQSILKNGVDLASMSRSTPLKTAEEIRRDWLLKRVGKFTASEFYRLITPLTKKDIANGELLTKGGRTCVEEKAVEELAELVEDSYISSSMQWGIDNELGAIKAFENRTGIKTKNTGVKQKFLTLGLSIGGTPDGLIRKLSGIEVKCPNSTTHFKYRKIKTTEDLKKNKPEYYWQIQGLMMIAKTNTWFFVSYDPRYKEKIHQLHYIEIKRNQEDIDFLMERLKTAIKLKNQLLTDFRQCNDVQVSQVEVLEIIGVSRTKLWKLRKSGKFPKPVTDIPLRWNNKDIESYVLEK